jgi:hypothetical protein
MRRLVPVLFGLFSLLLVSHAQQRGATMDGQALFDKGMNALIGSPINRDSVLALDYFRRSANAGYGPAEVVIGYFEETGTLVPREPQDAAVQYTRAAEQNDRLAQWLVGKLYFTGDAGTRDLNKAEDWLSRASDQGDPFGQYLLGLLKLERQDYAAAASNFRPAAEQGLPQAQRQLALLLKDGRGVSVDKAEAYTWLLLSTLPTAHRQVEPAAVNTNDLLAELEAALGSTAVERAKSKAHELEDSVDRSRNAHGCTGWPGEFKAIPSTPPPDLQKFCR